MTFPSFLFLLKISLSILTVRTIVHIHITSIDDDSRCSTWIERLISLGGESE